MKRINSHGRTNFSKFPFFLKMKFENNFIQRQSRANLKKELQKHALYVKPMEINEALVCTTFVQKDESFNAKLMNISGASFSFSISSTNYIVSPWNTYFQLLFFGRVHLILSPAYVDFFCWWPLNLWTRAKQRKWMCNPICFHFSHQKIPWSYQLTLLSICHTVKRSSPKHLSASLSLLWKQAMRNARFQVYIEFQTASCGHLSLSQ